MRIYLIAVGANLPHWVQEGYAEYAKRFAGDWQLQLIEIPAGKRGKNADLARLMHDEGERMLKAVPKSSRVIALDVRGEQWDTPTLARQAQKWQLTHSAVSLLIGGPEGLAPICYQHAAQKWSLSLLTLPHGLVRVVVAEQLYRAWSILHQHPYHRA
jgi:23S rRNA (pseudouridine1915-N3)-methyltransferase